MRQWTIKLWDGYCRQEFQRYGTYNQVANSLAGLPSAYIWSIE